MSDDEFVSEEGRALPIDGVLDLHAFQPREIADLVPTWLDECAAHGLTELRIVHGKGKGVQRRIVHAALARRSDVLDYRLAGVGRGGWGATLVTLKSASASEEMHAAARAAAQLEPSLAFGQQEGLFTLEARQLLATPRDAVFAFFSDAQNLRALTPPSLRPSTETPGPIAMQQGTAIDYRLVLGVVPLRFRAAISVWQPPHRFVDEQLRGPYSSWHHEHRFESHGSTGAHTLVIDHIAYGVFGGFAIDALVVRPLLRRAFAYRRARLAALFGEPSRT